MKLKYKRLESGFHYVVDESAAHLFAQFAKFPCGASDVSHNGVSQQHVLRFVNAVNLIGQGLSEETWI